MPTRSDRFFFCKRNVYTNEPSLQDTLKTPIARMDRMDQRLLEFRDQANISYRDLATRLERQEINQRRTAEEDGSRNDSGSLRRERAQPHNTTDTDAQYIKSVKVDASFFDGRLNPHDYID